MFFFIVEDAKWINLCAYLSGVLKKHCSTSFYVWSYIFFTRISVEWMFCKLITALLIDCIRCASDSRYCRFQNSHLVRYISRLVYIYLPPQSFSRCHLSRLRSSTYSVNFISIRYNYIEWNFQMFDLFTKPQFCTTLKSLDFKNLSFKNTRDFSVLKHGNSADFCKKKKTVHF